jgi:hypothetical protein
VKYRRAFLLAIRSISLWKRSHDVVATAGLELGYSVAGADDPEEPSTP